MSLRRKMSVQIALMLLGVLLISGAGLWGLDGLRQDYGLALGGYRELRVLFGTIGSHLAIARELLSAAPDQRDRAATQVQRAADEFDVYLAQFQDAPGQSPRDPQAEAAVRAALVDAANKLSAPAGSGSIDRDLADMKLIDAALTQTATYAISIQKVVESKQESAARLRRQTMLAVAIICGTVMCGAVALGLVQYFTVLSPLIRLGAGVRKIAAGEFKQRLDEHGTREFAELADEFNKMAAELDGFYHRLEQQVADKSRDLVKSERLAGIGFLAAGVAHEINNPIGIIAGYAEYTLSQLKQSPQPDKDAAASLEIICEEAFRCKDIVSKLLSLARPGPTQAGAIDLGEIARQVAAAVGGLADYKDRKLEIVAVPNDDLRIDGVEAEMKQVVLNLILNAMEAVSAGGQVRLEIARDNGSVELRVRDNGRGMGADVLDHVFEPFFTDKRGSRQPGTGLGLSITRAIVRSHGGSIRASSEGSGKGSEFLVSLPFAKGTVT